MSSTRSPSPKVPAIKRCAIVVSHGQPSDPDPAEDALAKMIPDLPGWRIDSATLAKPGALETALGQAGDAPVIYPMFMTDGWFVQTALRKRLKASPNSTVLPPLGMDPELCGLSIRALEGEMDRLRWRATDTTLLVAAHGSGRSPNSARATAQFVDRLSQKSNFAAIRTGYIEEPPLLEDVARLCPAQSICLPFFAAFGGHVQDDIQQALKAAGFSGPCLEPAGTLPGISTLMANRICEAAQEPST